MPLTEAERHAAWHLIELALHEDLNDRGDLTCAALVGDEDAGEVRVVVRRPGVLAGMPVAALVFDQLDRNVTWTTYIEDGESVSPGDVAATVAGPLRSLFSGERTSLNFLTHLSGVASLTRQYVDAVAGTKACILDTRKSLPGWRLLEKYGVRAGGGQNHRMGLYDGCLIKDNHLAAWAERQEKPTIADAVRQARQRVPRDLPVEVEVDTLGQLADALVGGPDIVLLDNMHPDTLREAVTLRDRTAPQVLLEASGGISLETVRDAAATGVDRISVGALTHSAVALDIAFDWKGRIQ